MRVPIGDAAELKFVVRHAPHSDRPAKVTDERAKVQALGRIHLARAALRARPKTRAQLNLEVVMGAHDRRLSRRCGWFWYNCEPRTSAFDARQKLLQFLIENISFGGGQDIRRPNPSAARERITMPIDQARSLANP